MFSLSEITTWSASDALSHLKQSLPADWTVQTSDSAEGATLQLENAEGEVEWASAHLDPKLLYLDALGWLRLRHHKPAPMWVPRVDMTPTRHATDRATPADPLDLDPDEVDAVYKKSR